MFVPLNTKRRQLAHAYILSTGHVEEKEKNSYDIQLMQSSIVKKKSFSTLMKKTKEQKEEKTYKHTGELMHLTYSF